MNVYDFDKTIYDGDSTIDFYFFCLSKRPQILSCVFKQAYGIILHKMHKITTKEMKEYFFSFLPLINDTDELAALFWEKNQRKIKKWYIHRKKETDVIISASPAFLLKPICDQLGFIELIATEMDINTGRITGENCKGEEKVRRFYELYPDAVIECFYSDSVTDSPCAQISKEAFLVEGELLKSWPKIKNNGSRIYE